MDRIAWMKMQTKDPLTSLLLHMDGADGAANFIDSSPYAHAITAQSGAVHGATYKKFGESALVLDGTGYLTFSASDKLDFGTGEFTVDFWVRFTSDPTSGVKCLVYGSAIGDLGLYLNSTQFIVTRNGVANDIVYSGHGMTTNTWYHIAVWREVNTLRLYINGAYKLSGVGTGKTFLFSNNSYVGANSGGNKWAGQMDEIRISKGIARWTAPFTPPIAPYTY